MNTCHIQKFDARNNFYKKGCLFTRRTLLKMFTFTALGRYITPVFADVQEAGALSKIRFGIVTDSHYADTDNRGKRCYRESLAKMEECVELMNDQKVDFLVELGDFKDQDAVATETGTIKHLKAIEKVFRKFKGPRYHVMGNHDADSISKKQFLKCIENSGISDDSKYYSFDSNGYHFVVLDANYSSDGTDYDHGKFNWIDTIIPRMELDWLDKDLSTTTRQTIIFIHQQLDDTGSECVKNAGAVRQVLEKSKKVLAVFQGHKHTGGYNHINGIHYYTLKGMIEGSGTDNNSYAIAEIHNDQSITITGYRKALSKNLSAPNKADKDNVK
ncbi:MAG: metallophosphoesterase [Kiritimatiellae bacterium]|nr:metallophosphoesterase [Kiritimatiellia bacterium]MDD5520481.1 metallophosphoesterase [Kiritimatiellia bacterium]